MKHEKATEGIQESAALYALGAMSQLEARAFETHLQEGCPVCAGELSIYEKVVDNLAFASPVAEPPLYLRELLLARTEREQRTPAPPAPAVLRQERARSLPSPTRPSLAAKILPWAAAAGFALLGLFFYRATTQLEREIAVERERLTEVMRDAEELKKVLDKETVLGEEFEHVKAFLRSPGLRLITLAGQQASPSSSGTVLWDTQRNRWAVMTNLPPLPAGKIYQLWFVTSEAKLSAGLIQTDSSGHGFTVVAVPPEIRRPRAAAVTLEPEGGSEQPTMPIYALGTVG